MARKNITIECQECNFIGRLSFNDELSLSKADICFCPVCGCDISRMEDEYDTNEEDLGDDKSIW